MQGPAHAVKESYASLLHFFPCISSNNRISSLSGSFTTNGPQPVVQPRMANGISVSPTPQSALAQSQTQQQIQQPPPQQQQQQQRPSYPWSARRFTLPPPIVLNKPGMAPPTAPSPSPFPRYGHAVPATCTPSGDLYLFGGLVREAAKNDLYLFNARESSFTLLQTGGEVPSPRVGHACAIVSNVLIVWGGDTAADPKGRSANGQDDGLYLLNLGA